MDIERLKELKKRVKQSANQDGTRLPKREMMNDLLELIDEAIARQSIKSEEVAEAIGYIEKLQQALENDMYWLSDKLMESFDLAITALQVYQPTTRKDRIVEEVAISKTATTKTETVEQCEWCKGKDFKVNPCGNGDYGIQAFLMKKGIIILQRHHALGYFDISFCPNCGRKLTCPKQFTTFGKH